MTMTKETVIQTITKELKEKGHKANQAMVKDALVVLEEVIDTVVANQDEVTIAGLKVSTKLQKGRKGTINLGARAGEEYETPDRIIPTVKFLPKKKQDLAVEA